MCSCDTGRVRWWRWTSGTARWPARTTVRGLDLDAVGEPVEFVVGDLSFISLTRVLDALVGVTDDEGDLVLMVKPQFEVGRDRVGKGGVVRDPALRAEAVATVAD